MGLVASCWFISLHRTFHDARSQEPKCTLFSLKPDNSWIFKAGNFL